MEWGTTTAMRLSVDQRWWSEVKEVKTARIVFCMQKVAVTVR